MVLNFSSCSSYFTLAGHVCKLSTLSFLCTGAEIKSRPVATLAAFQGNKMDWQAWFAYGIDSREFHTLVFSSYISARPVIHTLYYFSKRQRILRDIRRSNHWKHRRVNFEYEILANAKLYVIQGVEQWLRGDVWWMYPVVMILVTLSR